MYRYYISRKETVRLKKIIISFSTMFSLFSLKTYELLTWVRAIDFMWLGRRNDVTAGSSLPTALTHSIISLKSHHISYDIYQCKTSIPDVPYNSNNHTTTSNLVSCTLHGELLYIIFNDTGRMSPLIRTCIFASSPPSHFLSFSQFSFSFSQYLCLSPFLN